MPSGFNFGGGGGGDFLSALGNIGGILSGGGDKGPPQILFDDGNSLTDDELLRMLSEFMSPRLRNLQSQQTTQDRLMNIGSILSGNFF